MGPEKTLNARYCSTRCKALANANRKRLARFESRRERSAALASHKVWLFSFQKLVIGSAPAEAVGFQLGAALGDTVLWLPCQSGRKKSRRTLRETAAKYLDHFSLDPFEQPWVPKPGYYRGRWCFAEPGLHVEWTGCVYIPYGVPIWDLGFDANLLATEGRPTCKVMS